MFILMWIFSIVAAIVVGLRIPSWLIWRLCLFVPLFGVLAMSCCYGKSGGPITLTMLTDPNTWFWTAVFFVYGVILFGPSAIVLGG